MFPEGETTTFGIDCGLLCLVPFLEFVASTGDETFASVGVGGVTKVVGGASSRFGGVAGICVMMRFGAVPRRDGLDCVSWPVCICGGDATMGSSSTLASRFFPPNSAPRPPPLVLGLGASMSPAFFGEVDLRVGAKASLSFPTGDTPRLVEAMSIVLAWRRGR